MGMHSLKKRRSVASREKARKKFRDRQKTTNKKATRALEWLREGAPARIIS